MFTASFALWRSESLIVVVAVFMAAGVVVGMGKAAEGCAEGIVEGATIPASLLGVVGTAGGLLIEEGNVGMSWKPCTLGLVIK